MIKVDIELDPAGPRLDEGTARDICTHILKAEGVDDASVTLIFGSDDLLANLKKTFFNQDQLTDVIAFRLNDYAEKMVEGEIYISLPRALENAEERGEETDREVARLIIHGSLHMLDYSDDTEADRAAMRLHEDNFLSEVSWKMLSTELTDEE